MKPARNDDAWITSPMKPARNDDAWIASRIKPARNDSALLSGHTAIEKIDNAAAIRRIFFRVRDLNDGGAFFVQLLE